MRAKGDLQIPARFRARRVQTGRGYVLLVVIAVSVLVVTALSTLAKQSLRSGLQAADAQRSLQQRWGAHTLQRAMLAKAAEVFELREKIAAESNPGVPPPDNDPRCIDAERGHVRFAVG